MTATIRHRIRRLHLLTGAFLLLFIALHMFNHLAAFESPQPHIDRMESLLTTLVTIDRTVKEAVFEESSQ